MMLLSLQFPRILDRRPAEGRSILQHRPHPQISAAKDGNDSEDYKASNCTKYHI